MVSLGEDVLPVAGGQTVENRTVAGARTALAGVVALPAFLWGLLAGLVWWRCERRIPLRSFASASLLSHRSQDRALRRSKPSSGRLQP